MDSISGICHALWSKWLNSVIARADENDTGGPARSSDPCGWRIMQPRQWLSRRLEALRTAASRGATLVEYALVFSLLVVGALGAMDALTDSASEEIDNQALCVADRPPPTDSEADERCHFAPTPTDVITPDPSIVPPTTAPPNPNPDVYVITAGPTDQTTDGGWTVMQPVALTVQRWSDPLPPSEPAPGIRVRARIQLKDPNTGDNLPDPGFTDCVTDGAGECTLEYTVPFPDVLQVTLLVIGVDSPNPPDTMPPMATFDRP